MLAVDPEIIHNDKEMKTLGKKIRLLRHQKGWSQDEAAKKLDISIPAFSKIETGITDINLSRLEQIASLFGLSVTGLLELTEEGKIQQSAIEIAAVNQKLMEREAEVILLQKKVIELFEQLKVKKK